MGQHMHWKTRPLCGLLVCLVLVWLGVQTYTQAPPLPTLPPRGEITNPSKLFIHPGIEPTLRDQEYGSQDEENVNQRNDMTETKRVGQNKQNTKISNDEPNEVKEPKQDKQILKAPAAHTETSNVASALGAISGNNRTENVFQNPEDKINLPQIPIPDDFKEPAKEVDKYGFPLIRNTDDSVVVANYEDREQPLVSSLSDIISLFFQRAPAPEQAPKPPPGEIVIVLVLCKGNGSDIGLSTVRQIMQTQTLIKSAVALSSSFIKFVIISESKKIFYEIKYSTVSWSQSVRSRTKFEYQPMVYPEDKQHMKDLYRPCTTLTLFLATLLPQYDAVIYLDTDTLFFTPPELMWKQFEYFSPSQMIAMGPSRKAYDKVRETIPTQEVGYNGGVQLLNLTRIRFWPPGWPKVVDAIYRRYSDVVTEGDQDVLNILFSQYPEIVMRLNCSWNFHFTTCVDFRIRCPDTIRSGVSVLHGRMMTFFNSTHLINAELYSSWLEYRVGDSLRLLHTTILDRLRKVEEDGDQSCLTEPELLQLYGGQLGAAVEQLGEKEE